VAGKALAWIVLGGALLRFATLGTQDFWLDEVVTLDVIQRGPLDLLKGVQEGESNPALYYVLAGGWERVFGSGEIGVRSLSALFGTAAIPLMYGAARTLATQRAGLIAAAITAASPMLIWYSQEARNYVLLTLLAAAAFLCFAKALDERREQRWLWGWALASGLALCTHYYAVFVIAPCFAWLLLRRRGPRIEAVLAGGAVGVVVVALLPLLATQRGRGDWISDYGLGSRLQQIPEHFLAGFQVPWPVLPAVAIAVAAGAVAWGLARLRGRELRPVLVAWSVALGGFALALVFAATGDDFILSRNLLGLWPPFAVGLAVALAGAGRIGLAATGALVAIGAGLAIWMAATPAAQRPEHSNLAGVLGAADEQRLIVSQSTFSSPLTLYLEGARIATDAELRTEELVVLTPRPDEDHGVGPCWWIHTCGGVDLEPPPPFHVPPAFELAEELESEFYDVSIYRAPRATSIERPVQYFTPRVFVQPAG
jgi:4-amino-4-deoxy-L-arabinose transferase-like glycosyltransferase